MSSPATDVLHDFFPLLRIYRDGRVERFTGKDNLPASLDPITGVQSKDVEISPETGLSARLYLPRITNPDDKLPLLIYFHGGGFIAESTFSPLYHNYLNSVVAKGNTVAVSVEYRLAPEHPLPTGYEDCWAAIKWVASHCSGGGPEAWLEDHADFRRVFFAGDSAGANIAHHMAIRVGSEETGGFRLAGVVLVHPYFWGKEPIGGEEGIPMEKRGFAEKLWMVAKPSSAGADDPMFNPGMDPELSRVGCRRVLVCVAEKDMFKDRGWRYGEELGGRSGWGGKVEVVESKGEDHVFHLFNPTCDTAVALLTRLASFINQDQE